MALLPTSALHQTNSFNSLRQSKTKRDISMDVESLTVDEVMEVVEYAVTLFEAFHVPIDRTPLEAPPVDMSWLEMEDAQTGKPATTSWEQPPESQFTAKQYALGG